MLPNFIKLTEDVHSQLALSDEADKIFDTVIKSIIKVVKNPEKFNEVFKYGKDLTNKYGLLVDPTLYKDINPINTKKLKIYLAKRDNFDIGTNAIYAHNFDKSGAHHNIVLYVISKEAKTEEDIIKSLSNILKSSAKLRGAFTHEYTHLNDNMRYKNKNIKDNEFERPYSDDIFDEMEAGNLQKYFETNYEFNAFMMDGLNQMKRQILRGAEHINMLSPEKRNKFIEITKQDLPLHPTQESIKMLISRFWKSDFIEAIGKNPKLKKKVVKRIINAYEVLVPVLYDALKTYE